MSKADDYDTPMQEAELNSLYKEIESLKTERDGFREAALKLGHALSVQRMWNAELEWMSEVTGKLGPFTTKDFNDTYQAADKAIREVQGLFCVCKVTPKEVLLGHDLLCPARKF